MYDSNSFLRVRPINRFLIGPLNPIPHGSHEIWNYGKWRRVVVGPRVVMYSIVHLGIRIASALCPKLEDGPFFAMFSIEKANELIEGISVGFPGPY